MQIKSSKSLSFLTALLVAAAMLVPTLSGCDISPSQKVEWEPGNDLAIIGPGSYQNDIRPYVRRLRRVLAFFFVRAHNLAWDYSWNVTPDLPSAVLQEEMYFRIDYTEPGTYVVTVETTIEGQTYDDTVEVAIAAPRPPTQIGRLPQYSLLNTLLGASSLSVPDSLVTILAPGQDALLATFDADGDGAIETAEVPADSVLTDLVGTLVIPATVTADTISKGFRTFTTLEGEEVIFQGSGDALTVVVENDMGEIISQAPATFSDLPLAFGSIVDLNDFIAPASAAVQINDQTAVDSVTVASVYLAQGGFVAIHDSSLFDGNVTGSVIGVSEKLEAGIYNSVEVALFESVPGAVFTQDSLQADQKLIAMPHRDSNSNGTYDFVTSGGLADGPYTDTTGPDDMTESAVVDPASIDAPPFEE